MSKQKTSLAHCSGCTKEIEVKVHTLQTGDIVHVVVCGDCRKKIMERGLNK